MAGEKILIVEDEGIVARETEFRLKDLGYNVCGLAASGAEAIKKAEKTRPDVVLMDIMLKGEMDGIDAALQIRSKLNVPVVYVTAHADETTLQRAKRTEPMGYLLKPFNERELHAAIEIAIYRHTTETLLKEREQLLGTTLKSIGDAVIVTDTAGAVTFMNPVAEVLTRCKLKEVSGLPVTQVFAVVNETTHTLAQHPVMRALSESVVTTARNHLLASRGGREIRVDGTATPIVDDEGRVHGAVLVFRDVSGYRKADESLRIAQQSVDLMSVAVMRLGSDGRILYANDAASRVIGYTWDDLIWMSMQDLDPSLRGSRWDLHMERLREKVTLTYETTLQAKKGDPVSVEMGAHYFLFDQDEFVLLVLRDIAKEKAVRDHRLKEGTYARGLVDSANVMIIGLDREGAIRSFNKEVEDATGYAKSSLDGKNLFEVILPISKNVSIWRSFLDWQASRLQLPVTFEAPLATKSGAKRLISWRINETRDETGITGLALVGIDVTDQKQIEQRLSLRNEELLSLRRISEITMRVASVEEVFQAVTEEVASTADYPFVAVEQYDEERQRMVLRGVKSLIPVPQNMEVPLDETLSGVAVQTGHLLVERSVAKKSEYANGFIRKIGISTCICVPIIVNQRVFGALTLGHTEAADVSDQLEHYAVAVANHLALLVRSREPEEVKVGAKGLLRELLDGWPEAFFECSGESITMANRSAISLFNGSNPEELVGKSLLDLVHQDDRRLLEPYLRKDAGETEALPLAEVRLLAANGSGIDKEAAVTIVGVAGSGRLFTLIRDITGQKEEERKARAEAEEWRRRAEEQEQRKEEEKPQSGEAGCPQETVDVYLYRPVFENIGVPAFVAGQNSIISFANEEFAKLAGCSRQELEGARNWQEFVALDDLPAVEEYLKLLLGDPDRAPRRHDVRIVSGDGAVKEMRLTATAIPGSDQAVFCLADMRERKWAEQAWLESEKKYKQVIDTVREGIWVLDADGTTTFVSDRMARMLKYDPDEMVGRRFFLFIDVKDAEKAGQRWEQCRQGMKEEYEAEFICKDGKTVYTRLISAPILDDGGAFRGSMFSVTDISEPKTAEEKIRASLKEKEVYLREIHHRVKNNLQVVSSLLYLQSKNVTDPRLLEILLESQERVRSIALIHEQLYKSVDLTHVNFRDYLSSLTTNLFQTYGAKNGEVKLKTDINERVSFTLDKAIPCGLIVNELVSNALKHGFADRAEGTVSIELRQNQDGTASLVVGDDGVGLPSHIDFRHTPSLGLQLVNTLVNQLGGTIQLTRKKGTVFTVTFA